MLFDGDEKNYELWETRFLAHMQLRKLKETILTEPDIGEDEDANEEAYAELVQCLDNKSLRSISL